MLTNRKSHRVILLSLIAFLSFLGCNKMENETSSSLMMLSSSPQSLLNSDIAAKSSVITSTTYFPMIDLSVLGNPKPECAYEVNNLGEVVGTVPGWGPPLAFLWSRQDGVKYLGTLGGVEHSFSMANDINDRGQVIGTSWEPTTPAMRAFLWSNNIGMVNLGTIEGENPPEDDFSYAFGINNNGEIVGHVYGHAFLWTESRGMVNLSSPYYQSTAWDINDKGCIVGSFSMEYPIHRAALWTDVGEMLDLGTINEHSYSQALGINNLGEIVGGSSDGFGFCEFERIGSGIFYNIVFDHSCVPFMWTKKCGLFNLPMLGGAAGCAHAINDRGQIVGWSLTAVDQEGNQKGHAFVWTSKNGIKDLGTLPGDAESVAYSINNLGQIAGYSMKEDGTRHAVIWTVK